MTIWFNEFLEMKCVDSGANVNVAKIINDYVSENAKDPNMQLSNSADMV